MKNLFIIFSFLITTNCFVSKSSTDKTYYIFVNPNDTLFKKKIFKNGASINYGCHCYARKNNLEFTSANADTIETYTRDTLPKKVYSMLEFAQVANKARNEFKNMDVGQAKIYIIELTKQKKYHYYKATFYTVENDD